MVFYNFTMLSKMLRCSGRGRFRRLIAASAVALMMMVTLGWLAHYNRRSNINVDQLVGERMTSKRTANENSDETWLNKTITSMMSKPWLPKKNRNWCVVSSTASEMREEDGNGLWFVKNYKSASSTGAAVTARIAHSVVDRIWNSTTTPATASSSSSSPPPRLLHCVYHASHDFADSGQHRQPRNKERSFLWTIVRHPIDRVLSGYSYFRAAGRTTIPNVDEEIMMYAASERSAQVKLLDTTDFWHSMSSKDRISPKEAVRGIHKSIISAYDFIGVQNRMDESLAVLKLLLDLDDSWDVVVLPSKRVGTFSRGPTGKCVKIVQLSMLNHSIGRTATEFLENDFIDFRYNFDLILYEAANHMLDLTIDYIGKAVVQDEMNRQQQMRQMAHDVCLPNAKFPCSSGGKLQLGLSKDDCYDQDWGCGYACLDGLRHVI